MANSPWARRPFRLRLDAPGGAILGLAFFVYIASKSGRRPSRAPGGGLATGRRFWEKGAVVPISGN